ncbi:MAG: hypothetical protein ACREQ9_14145 [Candidatus Binatia bacterium]
MSGAAATSKEQPYPRRAIGDETLPVFGVALLVAFGVCALVGRVVSLAVPRPAPLVAPEAAAPAGEQNAARELAAELGRSVVDPERILSLVAEAGMRPDEAAGALRLVRRAAVAGGSADKARTLGGVIARLETQPVTR